MTDPPSLLERVDNTHLPMLLARGVLGIAFIYYGIHKISDPIDFLKQIREYHLFPLSPPEFINMTAVVMPWIEVLCGVLLLVGLWLRGAAFMVLAMLTVFTTAIFIRTMRVYGEGGQSFCKIAFDCGCGAGLIVICKKLAMNLSMIGLALVGLLSRSRRYAVESLRAKAPAR